MNIWQIIIIYFLRRRKKTGSVSIGMHKQVEMTHNPRVEVDVVHTDRVSRKFHMQINLSARFTDSHPMLWNYKQTLHLEPISE